MKRSKCTGNRSKKETQKKTRAFEPSGHVHSGWGQTTHDVERMAELDIERRPKDANVQQRDPVKAEMPSISSCLQEGIRDSKQDEQKKSRAHKLENNETYCKSIADMGNRIKENELMKIADEDKLNKKGNFMKIEDEDEMNLKEGANKRIVYSKADEKEHIMNSKEDETFKKEQNMNLEKDATNCHIPKHRARYREQGGALQEHR